MEAKNEIKVIEETDTSDLFKQLASTYGYDDRNVVVFDRLFRTSHFILLINQYAHSFIEQYSRLICGAHFTYCTGC